MTVLEKRNVERSKSTLMVSFRQNTKSHDYLSGITNNCSHKGINLETGRLEYNPGDVLELSLKHPYRELSVEVIGEIVWKTEGWYKSITGIKLREMDSDRDDKMKDLMSNTINADDSPPSLQSEAELPLVMEQEQAVIHEPVTKTEITVYHENSSSIPEEEVSLTPQEKSEANVHKSRNENPPVKILRKMGPLLILFCILFAFVTVTTRGRSSENDNKILQSGPSQNTSAVQEQPLLSKSIIFDLDSDVISSMYFPDIDTLVKALLNKPEAMLKVEGYADSIGEELYNLDLAMRRAWEVKKLILKKGIQDKRIKITVYGESYPLSPDNDENESPKDRRVDLLFVPHGGSI